MSKKIPNPEILTLKNNMYLDVPNSRESITLLKKGQDELDRSRSLKERQDSISNQSMSKLNNSKNALIQNKGEKDSLLNKLHIKNNFSRNSKSIEESDKESKKSDVKSEIKKSEKKIIELQNMEVNKRQSSMKKSLSKSFNEEPEQDQDDGQKQASPKQNFRKLVKKEKIVSTIFIIILYNLV